MKIRNKMPQISLKVQNNFIVFFSQQICTKQLNLKLLMLHFFIYKEKDGKNNKKDRQVTKMTWLTICLIMRDLMKENWSKQWNTYEAFKRKTVMFKINK